MDDDAQRHLGTGVEEPGADSVAEFVVDGDEIARLRVARYLAEHARENGRLETDELQLCPRLRPLGLRQRFAQL
jgi:hypothetical protein